MILQNPKLTIEVAVKHLQGLISTMEKFREEGIDNALSKAKNKAAMLNIEQDFPIVRSRKKKCCLEKLQKMRLLI